MKMCWRRGMGWHGGWFGPWPGRGPFSFLPPWHRPGWVFGQGSCWRFFRPGMFGAFGYSGTPGYSGFGLGGPINYPFMPYMGAPFNPYWRHPGMIPPYGYPY